ncbi:hypothetical protein HETIRDRAFT_103666 [Heterobasidion irregulare TC 32-1]|uniref:Uncharacterized protein n=1 Tax=Heterobasidion irregulare (strain TC 32-1) TaxID=747525 RepID=W4K1M3_HETIT|nr:uncharacterized protein HETIRDRAFT_103666 [Heterobasidion irregulare TC 32-1]ETW79723.1 hypothetical protein HETIRDRAFT_103666 [Heterobasidion irregulare TC 32-1]
MDETNILPSVTLDGASIPSSTLSANVDPSKLSKTVLDYIFAVAAVTLIAFLSGWRYAYLRRRSLPLRFFFRGSAHRAKHPQLPTITRPSSSRLSSLPALPAQAYVCSRARATGGRGGVGDPGSLSEEKEELPAYEDTRIGRPPGYVDVGLHDVHANMGAVSLAPPARPRPGAPIAEENT